MAGLPWRALWRALHDPVGLGSRRRALGQWLHWRVWWLSWEARRLDRKARRFAASWTGWHMSRRALNLALGILLILVAAGAAVWAASATSIQPASLLYLVYVGLALVLGVIATITLVWMLYAWRTPDSFTESRLSGVDADPACSFSLIVPARHESAVLETTLTGLLRSDHPAFEVIVVVGDDDKGTRDIAER